MIDKSTRAHLRMYRALGASIVVWARTEMFLNHALIVLVGSTEALAKPFVTTIDARRKIQRAQALAIYRFPQFKAEINKIFSEIERLRISRNKYIHTTWQTTALEGRGNLRVHGFAQRQEEVNPLLQEVEFTTAEVLLDSRKARKISKEAFHFFQNELKPLTMAK